MSESINYWLIRFGSVYPLFLHHQPPPPTSSLYLVSVPITCRRHLSFIILDSLAVMPVMRETRHEESVSLQGRERCRCSILTKVLLFSK
jgi:hypothetical protein